MNYIDRIAAIDPNRVTIETVKSLFPLMPKWMAKLILGTAVRRGEFARNPDGSVRLIPTPLPVDGRPKSD